jgi:pilus assembly protein Flp/PilA
VLNLVTNPLATIATLYSFAQERLEREEKGATAVEYGLMVGLIAVVIIAAVVLLGENLDKLFDTIGTKLGGTATGTAATTTGGN